MGFAIRGHQTQVQPWLCPSSELGLEVPRMQTAKQEPWIVDVCPGWMKLHNPQGLLVNARVWAQSLTWKVFQLMLMLSWEHGEGSCWADLCSDILKSLTDPTKWLLTFSDPDLHRSSRSKVHLAQQPVCSSDQQTMPGGRCPVETGPGHGTAL